MGINRQRPDSQPPQQGGPEPWFTCIPSFILLSLILNSTLIPQKFNCNSPLIKHSSPMISLLHGLSPSTVAGKKTSPFDVNFID